jgi:putative hemolysin
MRELGRLREIAFRAAGEGTGRGVDLDEFDPHYEHLFIWDRKAREPVGAYRVGFVDELLRGGMNRLYTSTLFEYAPGFFDQIGPAVELGRSFIRIECQRSYATLLLLWRGIGALLAQRPKYTTLIGAVSISRHYCDASRGLISSFFTSRPHPLAELVRPRCPVRPARVPQESWPVVQAAPPDWEELSSWVADLESDRKGLPILMRHYLKVGSQVLAFNLDVRFSDAMDALTILDLNATRDPLINRCRQHQAD